MRAVDVIRRKRDGEELNHAEIEAFAQATAKGRWEDYQLSALLMAIYLNGMTPNESAMLTAAMTESGMRYRWDDLPGPKIDKHSTGGVGDKTSLILAPLAAACGVIVPMMSGRGLGHSGGTIDKLESIPGFRIDLSEDELHMALKKVGIGMIGQSKHVAPADGKLYSLRDVTATVESIPLITASILSKKLAEGIDGLVMDVKCGLGAFMKTRDRARSLAELIVNVGRLNGLRTEALITAMDAPLGNAVGNALEVRECIDVLKGNGPKDAEQLSVILAARMVRLGGLAPSDADAEARVRRALSSGEAMDRFRRMVEQQGGDSRIVDDPARLPTAPHTTAVASNRRGYVTGLHAERIGIAATVLGAGRASAKDRIDPAVGIIVKAHLGHRVQPGDTIFEVHYRDEYSMAATMPVLQSAITIGDAAPEVASIVLEEVSR